MSFPNLVKDFVFEHLTVCDDSTSELSCYCPFHANTDSPAFFINKRTGLFHCFNPMCAKKGNFAQLVSLLTGQGMDSKWLKHDTTDDELMTMLFEGDKPKVQPDYDDALEKITIDYDRDTSCLDYLIERGFHTEVLRHFEIGFSRNKQRIVIPARDENHKVVGFIGRAIDEANKPKYLYTPNFPRKTCLWNLNNAKPYSSVIVTEGSLDAIKIHQAGFPNVVSTLGASIPPGQGDLLNKYFNNIILFLDNDPAGESAKHAIMEYTAKQDVWIVQYPQGLKDPGEMSDEQIRDILKYKINALDYYFMKENIK